MDQLEALSQERAVASAVISTGPRQPLARRDSGTAPSPDTLAARRVPEFPNRACFRYNARSRVCPVVGQWPARSVISPQAPADRALFASIFRFGRQSVSGYFWTRNQRVTVCETYL
jgi:hypothetical protein